MAVTIDSIYKPVNDYFLDLYKTEVNSPIFFKFDKFGSSEDFSDPDNPNADIALERFSDLVNRVPVESTDGVNIMFSQNLIDETYFYRLLNASFPFVDENDPNKDEQITAISKIIGDAKREFDKCSFPRNGIPSFFRACYSSPSSWYNSQDDEFWKFWPFEAHEPQTPEPDNTNRSKLWKLKLSDSVLQEILQVKPAEPVVPANIYDRIVKVKTDNISPGIDKKIFSFQPGKDFTNLASPARSAPVTLGKRKLSSVNKFATPLRNLNLADNFSLHNSVQKAISKLDVKKGYEVNQIIKENATAQQVSTNYLKISLKYCKVDIRRPWLFGTFLNNNSWFTPGIKKGELTDPAIPGNISAMPIGFIAIKELSIEANWSESDIANSKTATDFGPFQVNSGIVNNKLTNEGIQIIGWILQKMPSLPPNEAPVVNNA